MKHLKDLKVFTENEKYEENIYDKYYWLLPTDNRFETALKKNKM